MYSRVKKYDKRRFSIKLGILTLFVTLLVFGSTTSVNTASMLTLSEIEAESQIEIQPIAVDLKVNEPVSALTPKEEVIPATVQEVVTSQPVYQEVVPTSYQVNTAYPTVLANGNTAGVVGSEAAAQMAAATGVSQATWEYIIARESNGNPNAANPSGASGLFQTMPGWGSTATVQDQINAAINAYNNQGLAAWGM